MKLRASSKPQKRTVIVGNTCFNNASNDYSADSGRQSEFKNQNKKIQNKSVDSVEILNFLNFLKSRDFTSNRQGTFCSNSIRLDVQHELSNDKDSSEISFGKPEMHKWYLTSSIKKRKKSNFLKSQDFTFCSNSIRCPA